MRNIIIAFILILAACAPSLAPNYGPGTQTTGTWSSGAASGMDN